LIDDALRLASDARKFSIDLEHGAGLVVLNHERPEVLRRDVGRQLDLVGFAAVVSALRSWAVVVRQGVEAGRVRVGELNPFARLDTRGTDGDRLPQTFGGRRGLQHTTTTPPGGGQGFDSLKSTRRLTKSKQALVRLGSRAVPPARPLVDRATMPMTPPPAEEQKEEERQDAVIDEDIN
jgi:hypothetical protein